MATSTKATKPTKTTIFYVSSYGIMCQWKGSVTSKTDTHIVINFGSKAFRYDLKNSDFILVTNTAVKKVDFGRDVVCFDEAVKQLAISKTVGNVAMQWNGKEWI